MNPSHRFTRGKRAAALFLTCLFVVTPIFAQVTSDSLMSHELAAIVVGGGQEATVVAKTVQKVQLARIARQDAADVAQIMRLIPAAHTQTNSRGETLVYLRGAGERQVALFFEGALLNVPWDNRVDLSFIPSTVVGGMQVAKGVPSVLFGTNVLGGAVNLTSRSYEGTGSFTEVNGMLGSAGLRKASATHLGRRGNVSYTAAVGISDRNGFIIPDAAELPFSQDGADDVRLAGAALAVQQDLGKR